MLKQSAVKIVLFVFFIAGCFGFARADQYTSGVTYKGGNTATIWFKSNVNTSWVIAHYSVNAEPQLNVNMTYNPVTTQYEYLISAGNGNVVTTWYTFNDGTPAYNTAATSVTLSNAPPPITGVTDTIYLATGWAQLTSNSAQCALGSGATSLNGNAGAVSLQVSTSTCAITLKGTGAQAGNTAAVQLHFNSQFVLQPIASGDCAVNGKAGTCMAMPVVNGSNVNMPPATAVIGSVTPPTPPAPPTPPFPAAGVTFNVVNGTNGAYPDSQVYWTMVGMNPATNGYVHVNCSGALIPMNAADNSGQTKNGIGYANYSIPLSQCKSFTVPAITSARLYLTVGSPLYLQAVGTPATGYTGPNIDNPADPNIDVIFDFVEMDVSPTQIFANTTRVDQFGFPLRLRLQGQGGYDQTVGETETRAALFSEFVAHTPAAFQPLAQAPYAPYRIVAPIHGGFGPGGVNSTYLDGYIKAIWNQYKTKPLTFTDADGSFSGMVNANNQFVFTDASGIYYINQMPTTAQALAGDGPLADATNAAPGVATAKQLNIQAQMTAALNRHVAENAAVWYSSGSFYASAPTNYYAQFWHAHSINNLTYGFSYDDVGGFSSSVIATTPSIATITVGW